MVVPIRGLKARLNFIILCILGAALLADIILVIPAILRGVGEMAGQGQYILTETIAAHIEERFSQGLQETEALARLPELISLEPESLNKTLLTAQAANSFFDYFFVMDLEGRWISYPNQPDLVGSQMPQENMGWLKSVIAGGKTVVLNATRSRLGTLVSGCASPIFNGEGKPIAILRGVIVLSAQNSLLRMLSNFTRESKTASALVGPDGVVIVKNGIEYGPLPADLLNLSELEPIKRALNGGSGTLVYTDGKIRYLACFIPIPSCSWVILIQQNYELIISRARALALGSAGILLATIFLCLISLRIILSRSISQLSSLVTGLKKGSIPTKSKGQALDEIEALSLEFAQMYGEVHESRHQALLSESKLRSIFASSADAILILSLEGRIVELNQVACDLFGYSKESLLKADYRIFGSAGSAFLKEGVSECQLQASNGKALDMELNARVFDLAGEEMRLVIARDISERRRVEGERRRLEDSLEKLRRVESQGMLAAGIAHDFNNILQCIGTSAELLSDRIPMENATSETNLVNDIQAQVQKGSSLAKRLFQLGKKGEKTVEPLDAVSLVRENCAIFARGQTGVSLVLDAPDEALVINADRQRIEQALLNLLINASQAMNGSGKIEVSLERLAAPDEDLLRTQLGERACIKLCVKDEGPGIARETLEHLFEPFFTTKQSGNGLGLSSAFRTLRDHGGYITVASEPGHGARFSLYLPLAA